MQQVKLTLPRIVWIFFMYDAPSHSFSVELTLLSSRGAYALKWSQLAPLRMRYKIILQMGFLAEAV